MSVNTNAAPPGWHPDPSNPSAALRWWDGSAWTSHTHQAAGSQQPVAASPQPVAAVAQPVAASPYPPAANPYQAAVNMPTARPVPAAAWPGGSATIMPSQGNAGYGSGPYAPANLSFAKRNQLSLTAIGVVALYILLAMTTHFVLIGILPVLMSVRAIKAKETLAPAAVAAAILAVLVAVVALR